MDFDEQESDWFKANVELMISRLKDDERAERGLRITPAVNTGGSRTSARGKVIAQRMVEAQVQARAGKAAAGDAATVKAARAGALRAHTRTHSLTLPGPGEGSERASARVRAYTLYGAGRGCRC